MVVMEAMARGCIILSTPVGELPEHIHASLSGYLFGSVTEEDAIVEEACVRIAGLGGDSDLCRRISEHNIGYARAHFGTEAFRVSYRALLFPENAQA
ncbi:MAG: glycosyltransferase family 1 protein [Chitinophagia bacterium]|nr:glycosyltransferase family 1 protein [Chitinophagia bacterium]